ncbi:MAG TPA: transketolase [Solirubrobacterales bacterium]|nr:transketolase [Solirubrobacterales bacterium]
MTDSLASQSPELLAINTIRTLSIDAIDKANSGHPGTAMALAPLAYKIWQDYLRYDPADPHWPNRDRFVLSAGHASMLIYSVLHLAGVKKVEHDGTISDRLSVTLEDIENFRQLGSSTPGHPESHLTTGVETTTGPLGQGVATSVGMAIAGLWKRAAFGEELFDYDVYTICGDGDLMEGVSQEAASLAGHQQLHNLCWIYDSNRITIDGSTDLAFTEDVEARFVANGWNVHHVNDANDLDEIGVALDSFEAEKEKPTFILIHSHIGYGSPNKVDTADVHGNPLGAEETKLTKEVYGWPVDAHFLVPDGVYDTWNNGVGKRGAELSAAWKDRFDGAPEDTKNLIDTMLSGGLPDGWDADIPAFEAGEQVATRSAAQKTLQAIAPKVPWLISGSADLTGSASSGLKEEVSGVFDPENRSGNMLHLGVREHESAASSNGMALSSLRPVWSTYLIFSDYARPAIRLSALMEIPVVHWLTHDSIGLGEDGPTHQPVEQLASLRAMPNLDVIRPADAAEVAEAWKVIMPRTDHPTALVLTRQKVPVIDRSKFADASGLAKGGYVIADCDGEPELILIATGSEVHIALEAYETLTIEGVKVRVVSLPSWHIFENQDEAYRDSVLPPSVTRRISIEQASTFGWERYIGEEGVAIGMTTFGASAPFKDLQKYFGFTPDRVVEEAKNLLGS